MHDARKQYSKIFTVAVISIVAGVVLVAACLWMRRRVNNALDMERSLTRAGKRLVAISAEAPDGRAGRIITLSPLDLTTHQLFLRNPENDREWLYLDCEGRIRGSHGMITELQHLAELLLVPSGVSLFADGVPVAPSQDSLEALWVLDADAGTSPRPDVIPLLAVRDDFQREELQLHPSARVTAGTVELAQHGGGMPTTLEEELDFNFQRAVNPFSVHSSGDGCLTYRTHTPGRWGDTHAEVSFYFGVPRTGNVVDRDTVPTGTDMLVVMGPAGGNQVAFGWSGAERCFVLQTRSEREGWAVLSRWQEGRPPLTNWVRIGLECVRGHHVRGVLDGVEVLAAEMPFRQQGPFHIQGGEDLMEFDDVRAWSLPAPPPEASPLLTRSRYFAGKKRKDKADMEEFDEWASSSDAFEKVRWRDEETGAPFAAVVTGIALLGDFTYEAGPELGRGAHTDVTHCIGLYATGSEGRLDIRRDSPLVLIRAHCRENGWTIEKQEGNFPGGGADLTVPKLVLARRKDEGDRFCAHTPNGWLPVSGAVPGPVHLAIIRTVESPGERRFLLPPDPEHHSVRCTNLVNEFFEQAPADWNWVDGAFRMDCRWACQDQWNFMACGSTGLPAITGKRVFAGDQVHEVFMSLRATFPWDAGDTTFQYDSDSDRSNRFERLTEANAWYNRHDLNVSFCTDGRNLLSGYCLVFGGQENTVTRLLRCGETVAESRVLQHLFPLKKSFMAVHWPWWKFSLHKTGARIQVFLDDKPLFDYTDPDPIEGGHAAFWSVRNGFAMARISSMAETVYSRPHAYYVVDSAGPLGGEWRPLVRDAVTLTIDAETGLTRVINTFGGGFFAVRHVPEHPVDLTRTPCLELPLALGEGARVSLHLEIGGKPFIVRIGDSPLAGIKAFLVPGSEKGECFQLEVMPEAVVRTRHCLAELPGDGERLELDILAALRELAGDRVDPVLTCLTIGNSSNAGYLMAGSGGNEAGSSYTVGPPRFRKALSELGPD